MDKERAKLNLLTLKFQDPFEREYRIEQYKLFAVMLRRGIIGVSVPLLIVYFVKWLGWFPASMPWLSDAVVLGLSLVVALGFVVTFSKHRHIIGDFCMGFIVLVLICTMLWGTRFYPEVRRSFAHGIVFVFLVFNAALPYRYPFKVLTGLGCIVAFTALVVHDKIYTDATLLQIHFQLFMALAANVCIGYFLERFVRTQYLLRCELAEEKERSEQLLLNILPKSIADRMKLRLRNEVLVDSFSEVTVLFADIVGFTRLAESMSPQQVVKILNELFSRFDASADLLKIEKIKTIGDAYMAVSGLPEPCADHARQIAEFAFELREAVRKYSSLTGHKIGIRIGINSGPVVAGVIGRKKFLYDLWGDTVNIASRMESHGVAGEIQVTEATRRLLGDEYLFEDRGMLPIKGRGEIRAWTLKKPRLGP